MSEALPSVEDVLALPPVVTLTVPPEWEDINGHVNVQYYMTLYERAGPCMFRQLGVDDGYFREHAFGIFDLAHHVRYIAELHVGDEVSGHVRYVSRSAKRMLGVFFIINRTRGALSSTLEFLSIGADLNARRSTEVPAIMGERIDALIAEHSRLAWPVPLSGVLSS